MKKLWMRAGISLMLADEEIDEILGGCEGFAGEEAVVAALREGRFTFDGDSYIPQSTVEEFTKEHGLPYAAKEPEFCLHPLGGFRLTGEEANQGNDCEGICPSCGTPGKGMHSGAPDGCHCGAADGHGNPLRPNGVESMTGVDGGSAVLRVMGDRNIPLMGALLELQMRQPEILSGLVEVIPADGEPLCFSEVRRFHPPYLKALNDISQILQNNGYEAASKFLNCSFEL